MPRDPRAWLWDIQQATIGDTRVWRIAQIVLPPVAQAVDQLLGAP